MSLGPPSLVPFCPHSSEDERVKPPSTWEELTHFPSSARLRGAEGAHGRNQGVSWGSQAKAWVSCRQGTSASSCENLASWMGVAQAGPCDWRASWYWWLHSCSCLTPNPGEGFDKAGCSPAGLLSHPVNSWLRGLRKGCMSSGLGKFTIKPKCPGRNSCSEECNKYLWFLIFWFSQLWTRFKNIMKHYSSFAKTHMCPLLGRPRDQEKSIHGCHF